MDRRSGNSNPMHNPLSSEFGITTFHGIEQFVVDEVSTFKLVRRFCDCDIHQYRAVLLIEWINFDTVRAGRYSACTIRPKGRYVAGCKLCLMTTVGLFVCSQPKNTLAARGRGCLVRRAKPSLPECMPKLTIIGCICASPFSHKRYEPGVAFVSGAKLSLFIRRYIKSLLPTWFFHCPRPF